MLIVRMAGVKRARHARRLLGRRTGVGSGHAQHDWP
jgi:hypothetical protein